MNASRLLVCCAVFMWLLYAAIVLSSSVPSWMPLWLHEILLLPQGDADATVLARRGQFGDAFGAFNALVSMLALLGLLSTLRVQQKQLEAQQTQTHSEGQLARQQQFQDQYFRAIEAYRSLLLEFQVDGDRSDGSALNYIGRQALAELWNRFMLQPIARESTPISNAVRMRVEVSKFGDVDSQDKLKRSRNEIDNAWGKSATIPGVKKVALEAIGGHWWNLYATYQYQLDSIFRAWYTVYRILETAQKYNIDTEVIKLYSASFRAQVSWIEMAFLLANQSGLNPNEPFEKACKHSNKYAVFDNLAINDDVIVRFLAEIAIARGADTQSSQLTAAAFTS